MGPKEAPYATIGGHTCSMIGGCLPNLRTNDCFTTLPTMGAGLFLPMHAFLPAAVGLLAVVGGNNFL